MFHPPIFICDVDAMCTDINAIGSIRCKNIDHVPKDEAQSAAIAWDPLHCDAPIVLECKDRKAVHTGTGKDACRHALVYGAHGISGGTSIWCIRVSNIEPEDWVSLGISGRHLENMVGHVQDFNDAYG